MPPPSSVALEAPVGGAVLLVTACDAATATLGRLGHGARIELYEVVDGVLYPPVLLTQRATADSGLTALLKGAQVVLCCGIAQGALRQLRARGTLVLTPWEPGLSCSEAAECWARGEARRFRRTTPGRCAHSVMTGSGG